MLLSEVVPPKFHVSSSVNGCVNLINAASNIISIAPIGITEAIAKTSTPTVLTKNFCRVEFISCPLVVIMKALTELRRPFSLIQIYYTKKIPISEDQVEATTMAVGGTIPIISN